MPNAPSGLANAHPQRMNCLQFAELADDEGAVFCLWELKTMSVPQFSRRFQLGLDVQSVFRRREYPMLILLIILLLLLGGGGGYYGHSRWGYGGGAGVGLRPILLVLLLAFLFGGGH